jgi:hypothetical protein
MQSGKQRLSLNDLASKTLEAKELQRELTANSDRLRILTAQVALADKSDPSRQGMISEQNGLGARQCEIKRLLGDAASVILRDKERTEAEIDGLRREISLLRERVSVGALRREEMVKVLVVLVGAEDNEALSDEEYDARIDACVRRARTLLSLEKADA